MESFSVFHQYVSQKDLPCVQAGQKQMALNAISRVLTDLYGEPDMGKLIRRSSLVQEATLFSRALQRYTCDKRVHTRDQISFFVKKILGETSIDANFLKKISAHLSDPKEDYEKIIPSYVLKRKLIADADTFKVWITEVLVHSKIKSQTTLRNMFTFVCKFLIDFEWSPLHPKKFLVDVDREAIRAFCRDERTKYNWLRVFLVDVLKEEFPPEWFIQHVKAARHRAKPAFAPPEEVGDVHRISTEDIEKMYSVAKKDVFHELVFLLLLTTGMRVGGLVSIRLDEVAEINHGQVFVKKRGTALEKGGVWFPFAINPRVSQLIEEYISSVRPAWDVPSLFCGKTGKSVSTGRIYNVIKKISKDCGLEGKEFHPHAFRHTYAHILLECGNSAENVSKLLNHKSVDTTVRFYLKESPAELAQRCNIPWLQKEEKKDPVPKFLQTFI